MSSIFSFFLDLFWTFLSFFHFIHSFFQLLLYLSFFQLLLYLFVRLFLFFPLYHFSLLTPTFHSFLFTFYGNNRLVSYSYQTLLQHSSLTFINSYPISLLDQLSLMWKSVTMRNFYPFITCHFILWFFPKRHPLHYTIPKHLCTISHRYKHKRYLPQTNTLTPSFPRSLTCTSQINNHMKHTYEY